MGNTCFEIHGKYIDFKIHGEYMSKYMGNTWEIHGHFTSVKQRKQRH
jgi:hypothetical protein